MLGLSKLRRMMMPKKLKKGPKFKLMELKYARKKTSELRQKTKKCSKISA